MTDPENFHVSETESSEFGPQTSGVDPDTTEADIEAMMALVKPVLDGLFAAAAEGQEYWLKKRSAQLLSDWIISLLNISQVMEQQIQALAATVQAQEKELEQVRTVKSKMWSPGV